MLRKLAFIALVPMLISTGPALAVSAKEKRETCRIGANAEHLTGTKRATFLRRCMAKGNYEPKVRKNAMKNAKATKKPTAKK